jgi:hypothetical protein
VTEFQILKLLMTTVRFIKQHRHCNRYV